MPGRFRESVSRVSHPALVWLSALPRPVLPAIVVVLAVVGLVTPPAAGAVCFAVLALLVGWLAYLSWPALDPGGRVVRLVVCLVLVVVTVVRAGGWLR